MDVMTGQALPLPDRLMYYTLCKHCGLVLVTPITECCSGLLEQSLETGHMRIMAQTALAFGNRLMYYFSLELSPFVALKTGRFGKTGRSMDKRQDY